MQLTLFPLPAFYHTSYGVDSHEWYCITGVPLYRDGQITSMTGKTFVDIFKIDKALKNRFRREYPDNVSMSEFVRSKFGEDAHFILNKWTRV